VVDPAEAYDVLMGRRRQAGRLVAFRAKGLYGRKIIGFQYNTKCDIHAAMKWCVG
jgi:hypothetical protein